MPSTSTKDAAGKVSAIMPRNSDGIDDYTAASCLEKTVGDIIKARETATNARQYFVASLVFDAIFEQDMALIEILANRIDGTVPTSDNRESFANLMGDAIDDVLDMGNADQVKVYPSDRAIIALAKVVFHLATSPTRGNPVKKREKQKAVEMVYARTAGRRVEPVRPQLETRYVKPQWMEEDDGNV